MIVAISDLHIGIGDARDNFARNYKAFMHFLDWVEGQRSKLIICGDLFELWQNNVSACITRNVLLLDRLCDVEAIYVLGNHDADLNYFRHGWIGHPFFKQMCNEHTVDILGTKYTFTHGHQVDLACAGEKPGLGRISAIYTGIREDRNGSPYKKKYRTVENAVLGKYERMLNWVKKLSGKSYNATAMNNALLQAYPDQYVIAGHTHTAGSASRLFNTGTWAEFRNTFVQISDTGELGVFEWLNCEPKPYTNRLPV